MSSTPPFMPLYVAEYLADTQHLDAADSGAYLHLIMHYWRRRELPRDDASLARIARMSAKQWAARRTVVLALFDPDLRHKRIDEELDRYRRKVEENRKNGATGGRAKSLKKHTADLANATFSPPEKSGQPQQQPEPEQESEFSGDKLPQTQEEYAALELRLLTACGRENDRSAQLMVLTEPIGWLRQGCVMETDIIPVLNVARRERFRSWRYFTSRVLEARDRRIAMAEKRISVPFASSPATMRADNAARIASAFDAARARLAEQGRDA